MPVMTPAAWISPSYMPLAASGESSRNGELGSIRRSTRSRGRSLPRSTWSLRERSSPPSAAVAMRARRFATSEDMAVAFFLKDALPEEIVDLIALIRDSQNQQMDKFWDA